MGKQYGFYIRTERCVQCHACELACQSWNETGRELRWREVMEVWRGEFPDISNRSLSFSCAHCEKPACVEACPEEALSKRSEDGIVVVDTAKCVGCRTCGGACPFQVPRYGESGTMQKCDMCLNRVQKGRAPVCIETCPGEALKFGVLEDLIVGSAGNSAFRLSTPTVPSVLIAGDWTNDSVMKLFKKRT